ncbi:MAG TPA: flagellar hook-length control protein FliK [Pyrinomonadaceae bacterium]|jgi:flagellar hook-length control protein FliK
MKVESSKTNQAAERKVSTQNKNVNQTNVSPNKTDFLDTAPPPPPAKSFAQILEETKNQNGDEESIFDNRKSDRAKESHASDEAKNEKETSRDVQTRDAVEERERRQSDEQESGDGSSDTNSGFGAFVFQPDNKIFNTSSAPAARSILHVADLERIVSAIRAQNLKNAQAIVIALKHSVLEGLQIRLTVEENGKLKAEFLAASEQIKNQLDARRHELTAIIRERGINLSEMNIQQGSSFSPNTETGDNSLTEKNIPSVEASELSPDGSPEEPDNESNNRISYRV